MNIHCNQRSLFPILTYLLIPLIVIILCNELQAGKDPGKEMKLDTKFPFFDQLTALEKSFVTKVLEEKPVDSERISKGFIMSRKSKQPIYTSLALTEEEGKKVAKILAGLLNIEFVDLETTPMEKRSDFSVPSHIMLNKWVFPLDARGHELKLAMRDPKDLQTIEDVKLLTGKKVIPVVGTVSGIFRAITTSYEPMYSDGTPLASVSGLIHPPSDNFWDDRKITKQDKILNELSLIAGDGSEKDPFAGENDLVLSEVDERDSPTIRLVKLLFEQLIAKKGSEALIEADNTTTTIRIRVGASWEKFMVIHSFAYPALARNLKMMSGWNFDMPSETQTPRFEKWVDNQQYFFQLSITSTQRGRTIRILLVE
ncbi:MAG: hypothetical protein HQM10_12360 [Candidatus Riflebacteria bacterium]|nr:hypothetical protein [Candidatus Riflebacteria bacterium]